MGKLATITRRTFLVGGVAIAGGAAFGYWKYKQPHDNPLLDNLAEGDASLTPYVLIDQAGIHIVAPRAEMGQGVHTTLAALVAEELDLTLEQVKVMHGPAAKAYYNEATFTEALPFASFDNSALARNARKFMAVPAKFLAMQMTGGSSSVPDAYYKMRLAGATAKAALVAAAAQKLNVDASTLSTENGFVINGSHKLSYQELAPTAAGIELNSEPQLKPRSQWKLLGKTQQRVDMKDKSTGAPIFGVDVDLPNMLYATVRMNPSFGAPLNGFDASKAETMTGVKKVFQVDNGIAVIATNTWYAFEAAKAVECDWQAADFPQDTQSQFEHIEASFDEQFKDSQKLNEGDVDVALEAAQTIKAEYRVPYLAHSTMEPMNATALYKEDRLDVWAGNQFPTLARKFAAKLSGLDEAQVHIHTPMMGGGFGRRAEMDFVQQAVQIAMQMPNTPIKLTWTREEDMRHDYYRPAAIARAEGIVDGGVPHAYKLDVAAPSVIESQFGRAEIELSGADVTIVQALWDQPYEISNQRVTGYRVPAGFPVSSWRSVGASQNAFFNESFLDELAHSKQLDPIQMRLDMISHEPSRKVLEAVREASGWSRELPQGHALGVAFSMSFGVPVAEVVEVAEQNGAIKIIKVWCACDVGTALDPGNIEAQVFGGVYYGLSAAIAGEITLKDGQVEQSNFHNYTALRINQAPPVDVTILENGDHIRGIGEPGLPPIAPALTNAIFAATGKRIRELPLNKQISFL